MSTSSLEEIADFIKRAKSVVLAAHISPDSDAIGSSVGLTRLIKTLGIQATTYLFDRVPSRNAPFLGDSQVSHSVPTEAYDLLISVDTATQPRLGDANEELFRLASKTIVIDHHISNPGYGDLNFIDVAYASSSSIILHLGKLLGAQFDETTANLLLAGLMDDTGCFRFGNTTERVFFEAAELVRLGAKPEYVSELLYFSSPLRFLQLRSKLVDSLELIANGQVALGYITQKSLSDLGCTKDDADGLIEVLRSVENTKGAVFLRELEPTADRPERWKGSLRSKQGSFDANAVAGVFGGGGHIAAAGCTIEEPLAVIKLLLEAEIVKALSKK